MNRKIPQGENGYGTGAVYWTRWTNLPLVTAGQGEGVPTTAVQMTATNVTGTTAQYDAAVSISDLMAYTSFGDVMKESATAAVSYVRSHWKQLGLPENFYHKVDIHVHVPEGAVPKDGPSAGIALTTAIVSAFTKIPVRKEVAMTGEVTLRGRVLEIGGLKDKVLAAHRAGVKTVIAPENNRKDLEDIPDYVQKDLEFVFVKHMDDVLEVALTRPPTPASPRHTPSRLIHAIA